MRPLGLRPLDGSIDAYAGSSGAGSSPATASTSSSTTCRTTTSPRTRSAPRAQEALARSDAAIGALIEAAGGPDEFLERYAVVVCSDHGQTRVDRAVSLQAPFAGVDGVLVTASNRAGWSTGSRVPRGCGRAARRLDGEAAAEVVLFREGAEAVARRDGEELRFAPAAGLAHDGDLGLLDQPDALERSWAALANPNAGELLVSAAAGVEFADLAGRSHLGGGSHGSLDAGDSEVPILTVGIEASPAGSSTSPRLRSPTSGSSRRPTRGGSHAA